MTIRPIKTIHSYHAHIYFEGEEQRQIALALREAIAQRFPLLIGRVHDTPIGPHARPMFQLAFMPSEFPRIVPWLMLNRGGLAVLIHPNTGRPRQDHVSDAVWLGEIPDIIVQPYLVEHEEIESDYPANTQPTIEP